jgi:hypothetical protein
MLLSTALCRKNKIRNNFYYVTRKVWFQKTAMAEFFSILGEGRGMNKLQVNSAAKCMEQ